MREVAIVGVGMHKFGRYEDKSPDELGEVAVRNALNDAGVQWKDVQCLYAGSTMVGPTSGNLVANRLGMTGIPIINVEAYCAGSGVGTELAFQAVASGFYDTVVVLGFDKNPRGFIPVLNQPRWATIQGLEVMPCTGPALAAYQLLRHSGVTIEHLAKVAVKDRYNASLSPYSHYPGATVTFEEVMNAPKICEPFTMYMMGPPSDGAAAVVICNKATARKYTKKPITIASVAHVTQKYSPLEFLYHDLWRRGAYEAYEKAGIGPEDLSFAQVHNPLASMELDCCQKVGLCKEGEAGRLIDEGRITLTGDIPVCTDGGFLGRGNCPGATTAAYMAESVWQLRGQAGPRQIKDPKVGLICHGGYGDHVVGMILKN